LLLGQLQPFDAIVCTSEAARKLIHSVLEHVQKGFNRAYGTHLSFRARLELIPLGVDTTEEAGPILARKEPVPVFRSTALTTDLHLLSILLQSIPSKGITLAQLAQKARRRDPFEIDRARRHILQLIKLGLVSYSRG
jgi:hypothetical protein